MKLKLGTVVLSHRALINLFLSLLIFGVMIGAKIVIRNGHTDASLLPFTPIFAILITRLYRGIQTEIDSERLS